MKVAAMLAKTSFACMAMTDLEKSVASMPSSLVSGQESRRGGGANARRKAAINMEASVAKLTIDKCGFLRKDGKIISWAIADFLWAVKSWPACIRAALSEQKEERK